MAFAEMSSGGTHMETRAFFDPATFTVTYVVHDPDTGDAIIIDPVLDFDPLAWRTSTKSIDQVRQYMSEKSLNAKYILDTHAHADHLSGMDVLREAFGAPTGIGEHITAVQKTFAGAFNMKDFPSDGRQWDTLLKDGQKISAGSLDVEVVHTPGHTPACVTYAVGDSLFTGDAIFMPDYGTGRCDFPAGSASDLYDSITKKIYSRPDSTKIFVGHDYMPGGREVAWETTVGDSKAHNIRLRAETSKSDFVDRRETRDKDLAPPKLILQSLQVNIDAGRLPEPEDNGRRYFKLPINLLGS
jgi:glyoxylase-like metal-dependent hydrolase (beta-lactamase superfamily II)